MLRSLPGLARRGPRPRSLAGPLAAGSLLLALALLGAPRAQAQGVGGTVEGIATSEEDGTAIAFALVRLLRAAPDSAPPAQVVTGAAGRYRFPRVPAGDYRVQLLRIGHRPVTSPVVRVADGATVRQDLRAATRAVELPVVTVRAGEQCIGAAELADHPALATLWTEAQKGVEIRRAFERQYRFVRVVRQEGALQRRIGGAADLRRVDTLVNHPDSAQARDERRRVVHRERGYRTGNLVVLPDERDALHDDFLRDHCLDPEIAQGDGVLGLRFRPDGSRREGADIRGVIWVDAATYLMRRLDVEWLDGERVTASASVDYEDVPVGAAALRLPTGGRAALHRVSGPARLLISRATIALRYVYTDFAVGPAS